VADYFHSSCLARWDYDCPFETSDMLKNVLAVFEYHLGFYLLICLSDGGSMIDPHHGWNASLKPQFIGFVLSFMFIVAAYLIVRNHHLSGVLLSITIYGMAIVQVLIQLIFFLHLGLESKPHWNSITFLFTVLVIILVIGGSLWIMHNLNYDLMPGMTH
jgi:cytochrome o ubiquinol oxidase operon protein cyoD